MRCSDDYLLLYFLISHINSLNFVYRALSRGVMFIKLRTNSESNFSFSLAYDLSPMNADAGIIYAAFLLIGLYIMIIFEVINIARYLHSCKFYKYY